MARSTKKEAIFNIITAVALGGSLILRSFEPADELPDDASEADIRLGKISCIIRKASFVIGVVSLAAALVSAVIEIVDSIKSGRHKKSEEDDWTPGFDSDFAGFADDFDGLDENDGFSSDDDVEIGPGGMIFGEQN